MYRTSLKVLASIQQRLIFENRENEKWNNIEKAVNRKQYILYSVRADRNMWIS